MMDHCLGSFPKGTFEYGSGVGSGGGVGEGGGLGKTLPRAPRGLALALTSPHVPAVGAAEMWTSSVCAGP